MEASLARHVRAVMVARCVGRTCTLLASYLKYDRQLNGLTLSSFEDTAKQILASDAWEGFLESGQASLQLNQQDHAFVLYVDPVGRTFLAVVTAGYPIRLVISADGSGLLHELAAAVDGCGAPFDTAPERGLQAALLPDLTRICNKYEDLESLDKLTAVRMKTAAVAEIMNDNLRKMDDNLTKGEALTEKSKLLLDRAIEYESGATELRVSMCRRHAKLIVILTALAVLGVVALVLFLIGLF